MTNQQRRTAEDPEDALPQADYMALIQDLSNVMDLDAGIREATGSIAYTALVDDLAQHLDLDFGLIAVVDEPRAQPPDDDRSTRPASEPAAGHDRGLTALRVLPAVARLELRITPGFRRMRAFLRLEEVLATSAIEIDQIDQALTIIRAITHGSHVYLINPRSAWVIAQELDGALVLLHACRRAQELANELDLAYDLAKDAARGESLFRALETVHDRARAIAYDYANLIDPGRDLTDAIDRARTAVRADIGADVAPTINTARDLSREIGAALGAKFELRLRKARGLIRQRCIADGQELGLWRELLWTDIDEEDAIQRLADARIVLADVGDDFVGADVWSAHLPPEANLLGVRWSKNTLWPPGWTSVIRGMSEQIEPGIFKVTRRGDLQSDHVLVGV